MKKSKLFAFLTAILLLFSACIVSAQAAESESGAETPAESISETASGAETGTDTETDTSAKTLTAEEIESILADASPEQVKYIKAKIESVLSGLEGYNVTGWDKVAAWVTRNIYAVSWAIFGIGVVFAAFVYIRKNRGLMRQLATLNNNSVEIAKASHEDSGRALDAVKQYAAETAEMREAVAEMTEEVAEMLAAHESTSAERDAAVAEIDAQRKAETDAILLLADTLEAMMQCSRINDARKDEIAAKYAAAKRLIGGATDEKTGNG
jgi:hypothetical protein